MTEWNAKRTGKQKYSLHKVIFPFSLFNKQVRKGKEKTQAAKAVNRDEMRIWDSYKRQDNLRRF